MRKEFILSVILIPVLIIALSWVWPGILWSFIVIGPLLILGLYDMFQKKHALMRNYPIFGRGRYVMESLRPKVLQYFIENDIDGRPFNRVVRSVIYQRAKHVSDTTPFGTQLDVYETGYEWMTHSIAAINAHHMDKDPRILIGGPDCKQPYSCSIFNISAMSFGSLSKNAIMALNKGAAMSAIAHNTGEGGISPYHLKYQGDLIYQIGTGYFGCRNTDGTFSEEKFKETVSANSVKMIELKLSQGAKPGHGGILPASKNTPEIAKIRGVVPHTSVLSPPGHTAFSTPVGLLKFIKKLRDLSGGRPVGFKLCIGRKSEFIGICKAMIETGIKPDFITVDGGEGGTGAAPLEFSNSVGMPFRGALVFVHDTLVGFGLKKDIRILASGKISTGFQIVRALALGADVCMSARAMMMALGCIQALECNKNNCPTGVATQVPELVAGLDVNDKAQRIANYQDLTIEAFIELIAAAGLDDHKKISREHIFRKISHTEFKSYTELYPEIKDGSFLIGEVPKQFEADFSRATSEKFL